MRRISTKMESMSTMMKLLQRERRSKKQSRVMVPIYHEWKVGIILVVVIVKLSTCPKNSDS